jgi:ketosteroid isomerase-like protein
MEEAMEIDRRQLALPALALGLLSVVPAFAASADEEAVAKNVEAFRKAQMAANAEGLASLCAAELSYSHSDGRVEDKATFIANATSGKSKVLSLEYQDPKIAVVGPAAIVRFHWVGEAEAVADGKKSSTNLHILMNWQKQGSDWKLLSRAATKLGSRAYDAIAKSPAARRLAARSASRALRNNWPSSRLKRCDAAKNL